MTDNHDLNTPAKGATDWHEPLNQNFEDLDTILQSISTDGTSFSPTSLDADEITLGGTTHTSWPGGGDGTYFTSDTSTASDRVIVPDDAQELQEAIDTLDGTKTGVDDQGRASRPGGGAIMLKRTVYAPNSPITMKSGVRIIGCQPDLLLGRDNFQWQYSVLSGKNLGTGDPIVEYPANPDGSNQHAGLHNLMISGAGEDVHGIKINAGFGTTYHSNVTVARCHGSGFWTRGSLDTWLRDVTVKTNGSLASNNSLGYDAPAVRIESENDSVGSGSYDTQIRWYGGRISSRGPVTAVEASSALHRFYDCTIKMSDQPSTETAVIDFTEGSLLEVSRCTIDGYRNSNSIGILRGNNQVRLMESLVEKCGTGLAGEGNNKGKIANTTFRDFQNYGIHFSQRGALMSNVDVRGSRGDGVFVDSANVKLPWTNLRVMNNDGYGIRISGVKGGQPGDVPVVTNLRPHTPAVTNAPELLIVNGRWLVPYTYELGGSSGTVALSEKPADPLDVRIDPGGTATLTGFDGPTWSGKVVVAEHAGSGTLTLAHRDGSATNPLVHGSGSDETLGTNGQAIAYRYDGQNGQWRELWASA